MENKNIKRVKWGEIYYCDLNENIGSEQKGIRPVLVIQTNRLNSSSPTVMVAAITSVIKNEGMESHIVLTNECGLKEPSMVMMEQVMTVDVKHRLRDYVGTVSDKKTITAIKEGQKFVNGLPIKPPTKRVCRLMNLCPKCRERIFKNPDMILKRLDPLKGDMNLCELCSDDYGYEYIVYNKERQSVEPEVN